LLRHLTVIAAAGFAATASATTLTAFGAITASVLPAAGALRGLV